MKHAIAVPDSSLNDEIRISVIATGLNNGNQDDYFGIDKEINFREKSFFKWKYSFITCFRYRSRFHCFCRWKNY